MNRFVVDIPALVVANNTQNISTTLRLFGLQDWQQPYFISEGVPLMQYPEEGFRADFYIYAICLSGTASLSLNGEKIKLVKDDFFAAIPSTAIQVFEHSSSFRLKILLFERAFLLKNISDTRQLEQLGFFNYDTLAHIHLQKQEALFLKQKLDAIREKSMTTGLFHDTIIQSLLINLLFETAELYFKYMGETKKKALGSEELLYMKFMKLVNFHFKKEQQLGFYAEKLFVTPKHLITACKNVSGKTPGILIAETLLAEAKLLLALPEQNISTVSAELGYSSVAAFSKFFRKNAGVSPLAFRNG
ncbi:MAG: helix-turn-helix domain-containing protein [Chitinophagaceae bacterium]